MRFHKPISVTYLKKSRARLRVKEVTLPMATGVLGSYLYVKDLPEGHASCPKCQGYKFETTCLPGNNLIEMGCVQCGDRFYLKFPLDIVLPAGKFHCKRHPNKAQIAIHNLGTLCIGCEACKSEIRIQLRKDNIEEAPNVH